MPEVNDGFWGEREHHSFVTQFINQHNNNIIYHNNYIKSKPFT